MTRLVFPCGMSRSGTTLLTTILDSHPGISMGYELLPANLPATAEFIQLLGQALQDTDGSPRGTGNRLKSMGHEAAGVFVKRAARTLVDPHRLLVILQDMENAGIDRLDDIDARTDLSMRVVRSKMADENTTIGGYKVGPDLAARYERRFPDSATVFIVRDPRDVAASHIAREFPQSVPEVARTWQRSVHTARSHARQHAGRCVVIRYEDLVGDPSHVIPSLCDEIGIPFETSMLRFFDSKASIHTPGQRHVNADDLSRDFFTDSIGRWQAQLSREDLATIERQCRAGMRIFSYPCETTRGWIETGIEVRELGRRALRRVLPR